MAPIALVTGGYRGIGLAVSRGLAERGFSVLLTGRDKTRGETACRQLRAEGLDVRFWILDVLKEKDIHRVKSKLEKDAGGLDVLVNNAAVFIDPDSSILTVSRAMLQKTFETNSWAPLRVVQILSPILKQSRSRIINISSELGQLQSMASGHCAYRLSKTVLNAVTLMLHAELHPFGVVVNSVCPGWVKTRMGGAHAPRSVEQGADTVLWLASETDGTVSGGFYRDRQRMPW
jgi:NAD(P)-dependent dehydrogenase (short-subunit alcohol dehydrogenase family)